jgi:acylpyruvate hydrolase
MTTYKDLVTKQLPKILCIGKNYIKHVNEMGGSEAPKEPVIFQKPWSSLSYDPKTMTLPRSKDHRIDHEV